MLSGRFGCRGRVTTKEQEGFLSQSYVISMGNGTRLPYFWGGNTSETVKYFVSGTKKTDVKMGEVRKHCFGVERKRLTRCAIYL